MPRSLKVLSRIAACTACLLFVGCKGGNTIEMPTAPVQPNANDKPISVNSGGDGGALTSPKSGAKKK